MYGHNHHPELDDDCGDYDDWDAPDELAEDIHDISLGIDKAEDTMDLDRIALLGLEALALESWHDIYTFPEYAESCREVWLKALEVFDDITATRQQG